MICDLAPRPEFRHPEIALLATALDDGTRECRQELGPVTPEELAYRPTIGRHSAGAVLLHHAERETWWMRCMVSGEPESALYAHVPEFGPNWEDEGWPHLPDVTLEALHQRLDATRRDTLTRLAKIESPDALAASPETGGVTVRWVLQHLIWHESYHYGQAVLLVEMARAI